MRPCWRTRWQSWRCLGLCCPHRWKEGEGEGEVSTRLGLLSDRRWRDLLSLGLELAWWEFRLGQQRLQVLEPL